MVMKLSRTLCFPLIPSQKKLAALMQVHKFTSHIYIYNNSMICFRFRIGGQTVTLYSI